MLAVVRSGTLSGAARALAIEHSTVYRRLDHLERRLGVRLFERSRQGYAPSEHGHVVADAARRMEEAALAAERQVLGADARLTGDVRISTSELFASYLFPRLLAEFAARHPGITVQLTVTNRAVDLARREADLALRAAPAAPDHLVARHLADIRYAVHGAPLLLGAAPESAPLAALPWLALDGRLSSSPSAQWHRERWPEVRIRARFDSLMAMQRAAAAGVGLAVLPVFAAAQDPGLVRVGGLIQEVSMGVWLLFHPEVRGNARVKALAKYLTNGVPSLLTALAEGRPGAAPTT